jgi:uncharacterized protein (TIGR02231 family)
VSYYDGVIFAGQAFFFTKTYHMKKLTILVWGILFLGTVYGQNEKVQKFQPDPESLVVYLEGVEFSHQVPLKLTAGRHLLVFEGLSSKIDAQSIRVNTDPDVSVLSVSSKVDYLLRNEEKPRIKSLRDSVTLATNKLQLLLDEKDALVIEKDMMLKNQSIGGQQTGVNVTELQKAADFYTSRIFEINKRVSQIALLTADYTLTLANISNELNELNAKVSFERTEISVLVSVDREISCNFDLSYYVADAGWAPYYELRSEDIGQPIDLIYRAYVYNNTGIDWKNVNIVLSTGDPTKSVTQPKLSPWKLNYDYDIDNKDVNKYSYQANSNLNDNYYYRQQSEVNNTQQKGEVKYTTIEVSQLSVEFPIAAKYNIPSDSKPYIVDVNKFNLPATYKHFCIPKEDRDAFLLARITGWEDLNLVEGMANVYFGGSYVGQSYIYTRNVNDTLDLSLGRDNKVLVTRTKMKEYTDKQLIGTKRKETYRYQIIVKNNRKTPINIEIQDQVPVSENDEIEVIIDETSKAEYNILTGQCKWNFTIDPDKSESVNLQYTVKYPKNKAVQTKNESFKSKMAPDFY